MENRNRNTACMFIVTGLFLLFGNFIGFFTVTAFVVIILGVYKIRSGGDKFGYLLLAIGALILLNDQLVMIIAIIFIIAGYYYFKSNTHEKDGSFLRKHHLIEDLKWNKEQWVLNNMSRWSAIGEIRMDLSLAIIDAKETTVVLQGIIADVEIIVPEDIGVSVTSTVMIGESEIGKEKEAGLMNKIEWHSVNYASSEYKVRFELSYIIGDIKVKFI